jgi:membrane protein
MHAAGLTYFSLLAIVPTLCILLFAAKMFGVDGYAERQINIQLDAMIENIEKGQNDSLAILASSGKEDLEKKRIAAEQFASTAREISEALFDRIEQFDIGTLGWIGFIFLLWTIISSISTVEDSFNVIFEVKKPRVLWLKALLYLSIAVFLPIFAALVLSLPVLNVVKDIVTAVMGASWLTKWVSDGIIMIVDSWLFRFAVVFSLTSVTFAFFYWLLPNCPVKWRHALYGGLITAAFFGAWMKVCAVAQIGISKSSALYGSFAFLPIVLAWFYMSWQIVLFGACMTRSFSRVEIEREGEK